MEDKGDFLFRLRILASEDNSDWKLYRKLGLMQSRCGLRNEEVSPGEGRREIFPTLCLKLPIALISSDLSPPWGTKCPKSSFVVLTKLFCFSKMFFWEKQSEDIFLLFRIPNLLGSVRIYSSLWLFIVVHMAVAFCKISGDRVKNKDNSSGHGLMASSGGENKFPSEMREWFYFIILCPFTKAPILSTL